MVDWNDGTRNARCWVLKLLHDNLGPGNKLVEIGPSSTDQPYVYVFPYLTHDEKRRVLLINKRNRTFEVAVAGASGGEIEYVDQTTGFHPPGKAALNSDTVNLGGFSVAIVTLP